MKKEKTTGWQLQTKGETHFRSNHALELFLALAWPKKLNNNPQNTSTASTTKKWPKTSVNRQPKLTMKTMATLHSPKIGEREKSHHRQGKTRPTDVEIKSQPHAWAHNTPNIQCNYWRTHTSRKGERTDSQLVHKGKRYSQCKKWKKPPPTQRRDSQHSNDPQYHCCRTCTGRIMGKKSRLPLCTWGKRCIP